MDNSLDFINYNGGINKSIWDKKDLLDYYLNRDANNKDYYLKLDINGVAQYDAILSGTSAGPIIYSRITMPESLQFPIEKRISLLSYSEFDPIPRPIYGRLLSTKVLLDRSRCQYNKDADITILFNVDPIVECNKKILEVDKDSWNIDEMLKLFAYNRFNYCHIYAVINNGPRYSVAQIGNTNILTIVMESNKLSASTDIKLIYKDGVDEVELLNLKRDLRVDQKIELTRLIIPVEPVYSHKSIILI